MVIIGGCILLCCRSILCYEDGSLKRWFQTRGASAVAMGYMEKMSNSVANLENIYVYTYPHI